MFREEGCKVMFPSRACPDSLSPDGAKLTVETAHTRAQRHPRAPFHLHPGEPTVEVAIVEGQKQRVKLRVGVDHLPFRVNYRHRAASRHASGGLVPTRHMREGDSCKRAVGEPVHSLHAPVCQQLAPSFANKPAPTASNIITDASPINEEPCNVPWCDVCFLCRRRSDDVCVRVGGGGSSARLRCVWRNCGGRCAPKMEPRPKLLSASISIGIDQSRCQFEFLYFVESKGYHHHDRKRGTLQNLQLQCAKCSKRHVRYR